MKSMTGYGKGVASFDGRELTVELKSVNHRFLDLSFRMPRNLMFLEEDLRKAIGAFFSRLAFCLLFGSYTLTFRFLFLRDALTFRFLLLGNALFLSFFLFCNALFFGFLLFCQTLLRLFLETTRFLGCLSCCNSSGIQDLIGALTIDGNLVLRVQRIVCDDILLRICGCLIHRASWRNDHGALHDAGRSIFLEEAYKRFTRSKLGQNCFGVEIRVHAEALSSSFDGFLLRGSVRTQRMLDFVTQLRKHSVRNIRRILCAEVDSDSL